MTAKKIINSVNGHRKTILAVVLTAVVGGWAVSAQRHLEDVPVLRREFDNHMEDIPRLTKIVVDKADASDAAIHEKIDASKLSIEQQIHLQNEADAEWRKMKLEWDKENNGRIIDSLNKLDGKLDDVRDRLPAKAKP